MPPRSNSLTERVATKLSQRRGIHKSVARQIVLEIWPILVEEMLATGKMVIPGFITLSMGVSPPKWSFFAFREPKKVWVPERPYLHCKWLPKFKEAAFAASDKPTEAPFTTWKTTFAKWYDKAVLRLEARAARKEKRKQQIDQWKAERVAKEAQRVEDAVNRALEAHGVARMQGYLAEPAPVQTEEHGQVANPET